MIKRIARGAAQSAAVVAIFVALGLGAAVAQQPGMPGESPFAREIREVQGAAFQAGEALGLARGRLQGFLVGGIIIGAAAAAVHLRREAKRS